jgi:lipopolysaccharide transport system ATP-binding protein
VSRPIIEVRNLSKCYRLGSIGANSLRDEAEQLLGKIRNRKSRAANARDFWALRDVAFDVRPGEVLGIIGRNGAGKSTLLKILSRITEPTSGEAVLRGRVASLLEVGTGFHPELSGRENIYLNGAILGMKRREIAARFDEIVAFAEIEKFIDTPVKRYSSGMYVRLAFAVAAHLEAEILIVDEVLAVGDVEFQKKCLGAMQNLTHRDGRTILFVSHNLAAVKQLTSRCLYLVRGGIADQGATKAVLDSYARAAAKGLVGEGGSHSTILASHLTDAQGLHLAGYHGERDVFLELLIETTGHPGLSVECFLTDLDGNRLGMLSPGHYLGWKLPENPGTYRCRFPLALPRLASGNYGFDVSTTVHGSGPDHFVPDAVIFETSARLDFPVQWEMRKEYSAGFLVLEAGRPVILEKD